VVPDRAEYATSLARGAERMRAAGGRAVTEASRALAGERRVLERSNPQARLSASRQLAADLLDRATRALRVQLSTVRSAEDRLSAALAPAATRLVTQRRATLTAASAALGVLGPQATLDRGYGIVRRADDDRIVRDPSEAPSGTSLRVRVARGEFPATSAGGD
jgi:exodeoxyribonuclease VII large subunit